MNHQEALDAELTSALRRLPRQSAPESLRRQLEAQYLPSPPAAADPEPQPWKRRARQGLATIGFALAVAAGTVMVLRSDQRNDAMVTEAVNDHLRVLYSDHSVEIESGGIHQVKPWFTGKLDFAPVMPFAGDDDFPLVGGAVAYVTDRKAAAFEFRRRLHAITVLVFRAEGLAFPRTDRRVGRVDVATRTTRGFHEVIWRDGDLGYAVISDVDPAELATLVGKIAP